MAKTRREALSRERILRVALDLVDREGLDAISMRRVGEALGVEAMSLYNHVANKAAILDGIFEAVLAEMPPAKRASSWKASLRERGEALRAVLRAHPNTLPLFATRPAVTSASLAHLEAGLAVLRGAGFAPADALRAFQVLLAFAVGHAIASYSSIGADDLAPPVYDELSEREFPHVREMARVLGDRDLEAEFHYGLEALLAGIELRRATKRSSRQKTP